jgi:hypothetical protein
LWAYLIVRSKIQNEIGKDVIMIGDIMWHRTRDWIPFEGMWRNEDRRKDEREDENNVLGRKEYFQLLLFGIWIHLWELTSAVTLMVTEEEKSPS